MDIVVITGASSGIGKELAKYCSNKGLSLALLARRKNILDQLIKELPHSAIAVQCDLSNKQSIAEAVEAVFSWSTNIVGLVNNAGIFQPAPVEDDNDDPWLQQIEVNLMGPVRLTRKLWPKMIQQKQSSIVNISSTLGLRPIGNTSAYSASKAAMNNWTQALALEGAKHGLRANSICPGIVDTPIHGFHNSDNPEDIEAKSATQQAQPLLRIGQPQDIAPLAHHLLSHESSWTTGGLIPVDGGILLNS